MISDAMIGFLFLIGITYWLFCRKETFFWRMIGATLMALLGFYCILTGTGGFDNLLGYALTLVLILYAGKYWTELAGVIVSQA